MRHAWMRDHIYIIVHAVLQLKFIGWTQASRLTYIPESAAKCRKALRPQPTDWPHPSAPTPMPRRGDASFLNGATFKKVTQLARWSEGFHQTSTAVNAFVDEKDRKDRQRRNSDFLSRLRDAEERDKERVGQPQSVLGAPRLGVLPPASSGDDAAGGTHREITEAMRVAKIEAREAAAVERREARSKRLSSGELEAATEVRDAAR